MRAGFIGLGSQGMPMARRLAGSAEPVAVWARREEIAAKAAAWGARIAESPAELGRACDLVGICVFDAAGVDEVLFGPHGVARGMAAGGVVLIHTTVSPEQIRDIAERARAAGITVLDAPVSGGPVAAESGELLAMLAGPGEAAERALPFVRCFARTVVRFDEVGAASLAKLLNNALLAAQVALAEDALETGRRNGLADGLLEVLRSGSARSFALELLAASGSVDALVGGQFGPTIGKDIALLDETLGRSGPRSLVLELADGMNRRIARVAESTM